MGNTSIAWTEKSWNPIAAFDIATGKRGWFCVRVSPGCTNCYAAARNVWIGNGHDYRVPERQHIQLATVEKQLFEPFRWRKSHRVFVCSMTDLFFEGHTDEMIDRVFAVMAMTPHHTYQVLTKRPERAASYIMGLAAHRIGIEAQRFPVNPEYGGGPVGWPLPNVWLGVSAEDQQRADERIPQLLLIPAAVRWISYEPALGPMLLPDIANGSNLHWIVVGGESGGSAREFDIQWARDTVAQCRSRGIAPFVKQLGRRPFSHNGSITLNDSKGEAMDEWPSDLQVREYPQTDVGRSKLSELVPKGGEP